jgi:hypothetical protein
MRHESPEEIGFYPQCQWTFCTNEAMVILFADVSNGDPQGEQQTQMIYACNIHYGVWAQDLGISEDCIEELDNFIPF